VENVAHNLCFQWKGQSHSPAHVRANEIIPSVNRSFVYKAKEGGYVRIMYNTSVCQCNICKCKIMYRGGGVDRKVWTNVRSGDKLQKPIGSYALCVFVCR